ncbi:hypothetical protein COLO4_25568 [Corchorus olitorius]|uniref:Uncharacterized protein n=1 Tax=Corchorus olitorius TaxID=93759 RepID=A0A1R3I1N7_9ROSI|nr:hypothetical protein COLO4_25568 [Corchorus olitorius]
MSGTGDEEDMRLIPANPNLMVPARGRDAHIHNAGRPLTFTKYKLALVCFFAVGSFFGLLVAYKANEIPESVKFFWTCVSTVLSGGALALDVLDLFVYGVEQMSVLSFLFSSVGLIICISQLIGRGLPLDLYPFLLDVMICSVNLIEVMG